MDGSWLDDLARRQATHASRRQVIKGLAGGLFGLTVLGAAVSSTAAATCAGSHKSCADTQCCDGFTCDEHQICVAAQCSGLGAACQSNDQCCYGSICGETKTCIAAAECADAGGGCGGADELCCGDLICGADDTCIAADGTSGSDESAGGTTTLPNTGAGHGRSADNRLTEAAIAAGGAALLGGLLLHDRAAGKND